MTAIATSAAPRWPTVQDWVTDVREARRNYGKVIVERLKELNVERGRIGITGLGEVEGTRTPEGTIFYGTWKQIREAFPHAQLVDATAILDEVRYVKSDGRNRRACQVDGDQRIGDSSRDRSGQSRRQRLGSVGGDALRHDAQWLRAAGPLFLGVGKKSQAHA